MARASVQIVHAGPSVSRKIRRPSHTFAVKHGPMAIQPFFIAPVLPAETMINLLLQSRAVTDPIKNPLAGWWMEYYFFYVKHSDMIQAASSGGQTVAKELADMMLQPAWLSTDIDSPAGSTVKYEYQGGAAYVTHCLDAVVNAYFRDEEEDVSTAEGVNAQGLPMAHIKHPGWMDSFRKAITGDLEDVVIDPNVTPSDPLMASEFEAAMRQYELLKAGALINQTYEEFLATYNVTIPKETLHLPELVRYVRSWQYPSNTITQGTGATSSAVSWSVAERADKDRFFREPGFLFGVTVTRPKLYFGRQLGSAVGMLDRVYHWLPPVLRKDKMATYFAHLDATGGGPFGAFIVGDTEADTKDLYLYGDQFIAGWGTLAPPDGLYNGVAQPTSAALLRYLTAADISSLFVTATTAEFIRQDGVVELQIKGTVEDTSHSVRSSP